MGKNQIKMNSRNILKKYSNLFPIIFIIVIIAIVTSFQKEFFTLLSIQNVLTAATLIGVVAIGETNIIITGGIDLSAAYVMGLNGVVIAMLMRRLYLYGCSDLISITVGVVVCLLFSLIPGLINGLLIAKLKVPPFIATIGMMSVTQGAVYLISNGIPIIDLPKLSGIIGNSELLYYIPDKGWQITRPEGFATAKDLIKIMPWQVLMFFFIVAISYFILHKTVFGRHIYAIGCNIDAARFSGIPVDKVLIKTYMLGSLLYGIAGFLYAMRFSSAAPNMGEPMLLNAIGAVFIGGAGMTGGVGSIAGTVMGAIIIAILQTGLSTIGLAGFWQYVVVGLVIIFAVLFDRAKVRLIQ